MSILARLERNLPLIQTIALAGALLLAARISHQLTTAQRTAEMQYAQQLLLTNAVQQTHLTLASVQARLVHVTPPAGVAPAAVSHE